MVEGVTKGYEKRLEILGVGYRAAMQGQGPRGRRSASRTRSKSPAPQGIEFEVPTPTRIMVRGIDKQLVGQIAANIRKIRKPEPYKGKGIRYEGEYVAQEGRQGREGGAA